MKLKIETYLSVMRRDGDKMNRHTFLSGGAPVVYDESGYSSLKEMRSELKRRLAHRNPQEIPNGLRLRGDTDHEYQLVTLEP